MPLIELEFTPENNTENFPLPISGTYELKTLVIEADTVEGLTEAIRKMRIYFRFDFGSPKRNFAYSCHLNKHLIIAAELPTEIEFDDEFIEIDPKHNCTNAEVSIQDDIYAPVTKMTLTIEHL